LETLRERLEDGQVTITRGKRVAQYPTRFMLVAALNARPCRREVNAISDHAGT